MEGLILNLFGQPNLRQQDQVVELKSRKGWALLAYLVLMPNPVSRESLANLFWPEHDAVGGRRNLRRLLYTLNQSPIQPYLRTDGEAVSLDWDGQIDVRLFLNRLEEGDWGTAVTLYNGDLLDGVVIGDSSQFEDWLTDQREQLRQQMLRALTSLTDDYLENNNWIDAEATVRKQLSLDNWNELLWRRLITILASNGRRAQALAEYNNCRQLLKKELGIAPSNETNVLFESIRDGRFGSSAEGGQHFAVPPPRQLPHQAARAALLDNLEQYWLRPILGDYGEDELISLKRTSQPTALAYPWTTLIQRPPVKRRLVAPDRLISELFDDEGGALLILGEPGSGKTTTLFTLAAEKLERAKVDGAYPLPIILNLAGWNQQPFKDWVTQEIKEKYRILESVVSDWLDGNHLLLLCDGLDELPLEQQPGCVEAINQFREAQGLTPIAVSARKADYETLPTPLNLNGAILLQPLDKNQIDRFLNDQFAGLSALLAKRPKLQKMAQSPLLLSLLKAVAANKPADQLSAIADQPAELFGLYVHQMVSGSEEGDKDTNDVALIKHLKWLAVEMKARNLPTFLLDRIQPDWLNSRRQVGFYLFMSRFLGAFALAVAWAFRDAGWASVLFGLYVGALVGLCELVLFGRPGRWLTSAVDQWKAGRIDGQRLLRAIFVAVFIAFFLVQLGGLAIVNGVIFALFFGWRSDTKINFVEKLAWNWRTFGIGAGIGLLLGVSVFFYNRADLYAAGTGLLSFVVLFSAFGGLQGRAISTKTRPNEGMWLAWRNGLVGGAVVGGAMLLAALGVEIGRDGPLLVPFLVGLQYFVMAWLWYGGLDLINHFVLRSFLATSGRLPWRTTRFLEQASRKRLLYRVGSGYRFLHAGLRDYFAQSDQNDEGDREIE